MNKAIVLSLIVGLLMTSFIFAEPYKLVVSYEKAPLLDINILCTKNHGDLLFKGYDICVYIPNLNEALTCSYG